MLEVPTLAVKFRGVAVALLTVPPNIMALLVVANPSTFPLDGKEALCGGTGEYTEASLLFFDKLNSLAPRRGETRHGDSVMDRVVATLLSELDGVVVSSRGKASQSAHIVVITATNHPDLLDPSLLRPGQSERLLYLGPTRTKKHCLKNTTGSNLYVQIPGRVQCSYSIGTSCAVISFHAQWGHCNIEEKGASEGSNMAVDTDDVMDLWSKDKLQPTLIVENFVKAAKEIVPSISSADLERL